MLRNSRSISAAGAAGLACSILALSCVAAGCAESSSGNGELVVDGATLLDAGQRERIETFHRLLRADHDIDYRVVTIRDARDIDDHAVKLFESVEAGSLSSTGRGLLLLVDPELDRVRLEVGYGLEGTYPDAFIAYVEQRQMVPFFRVGRIADGVLATTELIVTRAQRVASNASLEGEVWLEGSGGGGASTSARIGAGPAITRYGTSTTLGAGASPAEVLARYFQAMRDRDANPDLDIYTPATRRMLRSWVMTPAQMDNVVKTYRRCHGETARIDPHRRYGVIRYPLDERQCAPWFFEKVDGAWALDLTMMQRALRFGRDNSWHFVPGAEHPYVYAFGDWSFDSHGYPHPE